MELKKFFKNFSQQRQIKQNPQKFSRTDRQNTKLPFSAKEPQIYARRKGIKNAFCHTFIFANA